MSDCGCDDSGGACEPAGCSDSSPANDCPSATDSHSPATDSHSHATDSHSHATDSHSHATDSHSHATDSHWHATDSHHHSDHHNNSLLAESGIPHDPHWEARHDHSVTSGHMIQNPMSHYRKTGSKNKDTRPMNSVPLNEIRDGVDTGSSNDLPDYDTACKNLNGVRDPCLNPYRTQPAHNPSYITSHENHTEPRYTAPRRTTYFTSLTPTSTPASSCSLRIILVVIISLVVVVLLLSTIPYYTTRRQAAVETHADMTDKWIKDFVAERNHHWTY